MSSSDLDKKYHNSLKTVEYNYHSFFPIGEPDEETIKLKFKVKAYRDAHILLSPCMFPDEGTPVYEIVLGAGNNTYSVIRRCQQGDERDSTESSEALVSPHEWSEFWIKIKKGKVKVGRGDEKAFLKFKDPEPVEINYYSFSSYEGTAALWIFPCFKEKDMWL